MPLRRSAPTMGVGARSTEGCVVRRQRLIALALAGLLGAVAGCTSKSGGPGGGGPGPVIDVLEAKITSPADGSADVPASTEIAFTSKGAATQAFKLVDGAGQE